MENQNNGTMELTQWQKAQKKSEFAREQMESLMEISGFGEHKCAKFIMNTCKPGQVQHTIALYKGIVTKIAAKKMPTKDVLEALWKESNYLEMFANHIDEERKFDADFFPEVLADLKNNWRAKQAILGAHWMLKVKLQQVDRKLKQGVKKSKTERTVRTQSAT